MTPISIFNEVLGPVMRGPSSSHTAASFQIGAMARSLLGGVPEKARVAFDPGGSYAQVYTQQGSDRAFVAGLMGWSITDPRFFDALTLADRAGLKISFHIEALRQADHPNTVSLDLQDKDGRKLHLTAKSVGGGAIVFTHLGRWPVRLTGDAHETLLELEAEGAQEASHLLQQDGCLVEPIRSQETNGLVLVHARRSLELEAQDRARLEDMPTVRGLWTAPPVFFVQSGDALFDSAEGAVRLAEERGCTLGEAGLLYESTLLGLDQEVVLAEMSRRFEVMKAAAELGLEDGQIQMRTLHPSAGSVYRAEAQGQVAIGGIHTRAAARAMAAMHVNGSHGVVCAAPTAGAAGTIPGVVVTLAEELELNQRQTALALLAASTVGLVVANRATFAAEIAGCQVEIGAAGAMGAAAVVEVAGGTPRQAVEAAAIAFQNTMGNICDPVQGIVEIPCHTRNAVAASSAFVCADLILGGYQNPVPLDETIDAVYAVGKMLPQELRCTALGGLSMAPSALALKQML
jgi:L-serine dehydratase